MRLFADRASDKAFTSLLSAQHWHAWIGDAAIADAIMGRVMRRDCRFTLIWYAPCAERPKKAQICKVAPIFLRGTY